MGSQATTCTGFGWVLLSLNSLARPLRGDQVEATSTCRFASLLIRMSSLSSAFEGRFLTTILVRVILIVKLSGTSILSSGEANCSVRGCPASQMTGGAGSAAVAALARLRRAWRVRLAGGPSTKSTGCWRFNCLGCLATVSLSSYEGSSGAVESPFPGARPRLRWLWVHPRIWTGPCCGGASTAE